MRKRIEAFLADLDQALAAHAQGASLKIYHIGRSALVWRYNYPVTTADVDIFRPRGHEALVELAVRLFGRDTPKAKEHDLYLQFVDEALPPAPYGYESRAVKVAGPWSVLTIYHLEPHDLAATKMRRFWPKDRADIRLLCDLGLLDAQQLEETLERAFVWNLPKDGDRYRDDAFDHLRDVQRYLRGEIAEF